MVIKNLFSRLSQTFKKGKNGTILVIGGSERYSGAPIFTSLGALRSGSDLVYIITDYRAVQNIKVLSEAVVIPYQFDKFILNKITACVIGPGLGELTQSNIRTINNIITYLNTKDIPFVFDADILHYYKHHLIIHPKICVLTPNKKESKELIVNTDHCCIYKGRHDIITYKGKSVKVKTTSSKKRCGGQGDILSGILATALSLDESDLLYTCYSACYVMRKASFLSFNKLGFSLITSDIFKSLTKVINHIKPPKTA